MTKIPSDSLKRVCLRADYTGVPFIDDWVKNDVYDSEIGKYFKDYQIAGRERLAFSSFSLEHLSELVDTPVEKLAKMKLHIFEDGKFSGKDDLMNLYLSTVSLELNIECKNFISIKPYMDLMMELVKQLKKENSKFRLRRFSIQKLNGFMSDNLEELKYMLNTDLFYRDQKYLQPGYETEYKDFFILDEPEAHLHNTRLFRVGGNPERPTYQAIVDTFGSVDVFMSPELPNIEVESLADVSSKLNESLKQSFAETLKRDYIESL